MHPFDCDCDWCRMDLHDWNVPEPEPIGDCAICSAPYFETCELERDPEDRTLHYRCFNTCWDCGGSIDAAPAEWTREGRRHATCPETAAEMAEGVLP